MTGPHPQNLSSQTLVPSTLENLRIRSGVRRCIVGIREMANKSSNLHIFAGVIYDKFESGTWTESLIGGVKGLQFCERSSPAGLYQAGWRLTRVHPVLSCSS